MPSCLMVVSHFPPFQSAGVFRTVRIAKYLPDHGWDLEVLTLKRDAYLNGSSMSSELLEEIPSQVVVHRTTAKHPLQWLAAAKGTLAWGRRSGDAAVAPLVKSQSQVSSSGAKPTTDQGPNPLKPKGAMQRAKDAITVPWMTPDRWIGWLPFATREGKRILRRNPIDLIYSSGPPWTNHLVAHRLREATGTPWVADFRDPWLGNNFRPQRQGDSWVGRKHQRLERAVIESANVVVVNTPRSHQSMCQRYPESPVSKFRVIPNGFDPSDFNITEDGARSRVESAGPSAQLRILHTGAFYGKRNVDALLNAIGELVQEGRLQRKDLQVELVGAARDKRTRESDIAAKWGISDIVRTLPRVSHEECLEKMSNADLLLLVQTEAPLCVPGKLYEYIAIGKPILTLAAEGATADLIAQEELGPCVDPENLEQLKDCLLGLVQEQQSIGLTLPSGSAVEHFNGRSLIKQFDVAFRDALTAH